MEGGGGRGADFYWSNSKTTFDQGEIWGKP